MFNLDKFLSFAGPRVYLQSLTNSLMAWLMSGAPSALVTALWKSASWAGVTATLPEPWPRLLFCCRLFRQVSSQLLAISCKKSQIVLKSFVLY